LNDAKKKNTFNTALKVVRINTREPPKLGIPRTLLSGKGVTRPTRVTTSNLAIVRQRVYTIERTQNWGALESRLLQVERGWRPKINTPLPITRSNLVVLRQRLYAQIEINTKVGSVGTPPPCGRGVGDPREIGSSPTCVILPNLVVLDQTVLAILRRSA